MLTFSKILSTLENLKFWKTSWDDFHILQFHENVNLKNRSRDFLLCVRVQLLHTQFQTSQEFPDRWVKYKKTSIQKNPVIIVLFLVGTSKLRQNLLKFTPNSPLPSWSYHQKQNHYFFLQCRTNPTFLRKFGRKTFHLNQFFAKVSLVLNLLYSSWTPENRTPMRNSKERHT